MALGFEVSKVKSR